LLENSTNSDDDVHSDYCSRTCVCSGYSGIPTDISTAYVETQAHN
jgi:hypothetical protein